MSQGQELLMRNDQIFVLLLFVLLPLAGCFDFYEDSDDSLHEYIVQYSEEEIEYESDEPNIQLEVDSNGLSSSSEHIYVNGTVLSGIPKRTLFSEPFQNRRCEGPPRTNV